MKSLVLITCAALSACNAKHDPVLQITLLRACVQAHTGLPEGTIGDVDMKGGIIVYCENFADVNSIVQKEKNQ